MRKISSFLYAFLLLGFSFQYYPAIENSVSGASRNSAYTLEEYNPLLNSSPYQKQNSGEVNSYSCAESISLINRQINHSGISATHLLTYLPYFFGSRILNINLRSVVIIFPFHFFG